MSMTTKEESARREEHQETVIAYDSRIFTEADRKGPLFAGRYDGYLVCVMMGIGPQLLVASMEYIGDHFGEFAHYALSLGGKRK